MNTKQNRDAFRTKDNGIVSDIVMTSIILQSDLYYKIGQRLGTIFDRNRQE